MQKLTKMNSITKVRYIIEFKSGKEEELQNCFRFLLQFKIFCFLCIAVTCLVQTINADDHLSVDFDPDLVFTKPQKPVLRHLSEPEQAEYKDFIQYLYRYDAKKSG